MVMLKSRVCLMATPLALTQQPEKVLTKENMATALTALFAAVREGNRSEVSKILVNTENTRLVNNPGDYNETLLHFAAEGGDKEICNLLLVAGARCDIVNAQKHTPLHRASFKGNHEALAAMLSE